MSSTHSAVDVKAAEDHLMQVPGGGRGHRPGGGHRRGGIRRTEEGRRAGVRHPLRQCEQTHPAADADRQPDRRSARHAPGPRLLFATHLDTVPLCAGAKPKREGDRIVSDGTTALGGDNRTGCAVLVTLAETLLKHKLPHPPITLLFTVREESGLHGARELDPADLGGATMGFNVDGKLAAELIIGAVGQENWEVEIFGKASHAGVAPEKGISATLVAPWP